MQRNTEETNMAETPVNERVAQHRRRKKAREFSERWLDGEEVATPEDFAEAKATEFGASVQASVVRWEASLLNAFYEILTEYQDENGEYEIADMLDVWEEAHAQR